MTTPAPLNAEELKPCREAIKDLQKSMAALSEALEVTDFERATGFNNWHSLCRDIARRADIATGSQKDAIARLFDSLVSSDKSCEVLLGIRPGVCGHANDSADNLSTLGFAIGQILGGMGARYAEHAALSTRALTASPVDAVGVRVAERLCADEHEITITQIIDLFKSPSFNKWIFAHGIRRFVSRIFDVAIDQLSNAPSLAVQPQDGWVLVPREPTGEMTDGLARLILLFMEGGARTGEHLHACLEMAEEPIPAWLTEVAPNDSTHIPKAALAELIYRAMLSAAPTQQQTKE